MLTTHLPLQRAQPSRGADACRHRCPAASIRSTKDHLSGNCIRTGAGRVYRGETGSCRPPMGWDTGPPAEKMPPSTASSESVTPSATRKSSTAAAAWRPSAIAHTTSDCPRRQSPAANTPCTPPHASQHPPSRPRPGSVHCLTRPGEAFMADPTVVLSPGCVTGRRADTRASAAAPERAGRMPSCHHARASTVRCAAPRMPHRRLPTSGAAGSLKCAAAAGESTGRSSPVFMQDIRQAPVRRRWQGSEAIVGRGAGGSPGRWSRRQRCRP